MIKVYCRTNMDDYKGKDWPTEMICRPLKGDRVRASCGASLRVVDVTHATRSDLSTSPNEFAGAPPKAYLIVELSCGYPGLGGE